MRGMIRTAGAILVLVSAAGAERFYVDGRDPTASDSGPGSLTIPWKSLAAVDRHSFRPGDVVYFARGSNYRGGFVVKGSGTASQPITFTWYGDGPAPSFTNSSFAVLNGNVIQIRGSYVTIDGLSFHDGKTRDSTLKSSFQVISARPRVSRFLATSFDTIGRPSGLTSARNAWERMGTA